jgi:Tfp pilus assembly protein FimT
VIWVIVWIAVVIAIIAALVYFAPPRGRAWRRRRTKQS